METGCRNMAATQKITYLTVVSYSLLHTVFRYDVPSGHNTKRHRQTTDRQTTDRRHGVPKARSIIRSATKPSLDSCKQTKVEVSATIPVPLVFWLSITAWSRIFHPLLYGADNSSLAFSVAPKIPLMMVLIKLMNSRLQFEIDTRY